MLGKFLRNSQAVYVHKYCTTCIGGHGLKTQGGGEEGGPSGGSPQVPRGGNSFLLPGGEGGGCKE